MAQVVGCEAFEHDPRRPLCSFDIGRSRVQKLVQGIDKPVQPCSSAQQGSVKGCLGAQCGTPHSICAIEQIRWLVVGGREVHARKRLLLDIASGCPGGRRCPEPPLKLGGLVEAVALKLDQKQVHVFGVLAGTPLSRPSARVVGEAGRGLPEQIRQLSKDRGVEISDPLSSTEQRRGALEAQASGGEVREAEGRFGEAFGRRPEVVEPVGNVFEG
mmetsp:Transcript_88717/g.225869  ORF Transcript_88717/g.225869 Transcript_88717/m.225869 type:complete len:215 (+) Transcript_88717:876-1520(+)